MKLALYVALLWAVWHIPDHFAVEGWGIEALISAPVVFAIEVVSLFFARALFVWFYNRTGSSVRLRMPSCRYSRPAGPAMQANATWYAVAPCRSAIRPGVWSESMFWTGARGRKAMRS